MSRVYTVLCAFVLTILFLWFHTTQIKGLYNEANLICDKIYQDFGNENWESVKTGMDNLDKRWNQSRFWTCLTVDTSQIEEIEIAMAQAREFAKLKADKEFIGEFAMMRLLLEHLPHQESMEFEDLL